MVLRCAKSQHLCNLYTSISKCYIYVITFIAHAWMSSHISNITYSVYIQKHTSSLRASCKFLYIYMNMCSMQVASSCETRRSRVYDPLTFVSQLPCHPAVCTTTTERQLRCRSVVVDAAFGWLRHLFDSGHRVVPLTRDDPLTFVSQIPTPPKILSNPYYVRVFREFRLHRQSLRSYRTSAFPFFVIFCGPSVLENPEKVQFCLRPFGTWQNRPLFSSKYSLALVFWPKKCKVYYIPTVMILGTTYLVSSTPDAFYSLRS